MSCSAFESLNLYSLICLLASPRTEENNQSPLRGEGEPTRQGCLGSKERTVRSKKTRQTHTGPPWHLRNQPRNCGRHGSSSTWVTTVSPASGLRGKFTLRPMMCVGRALSKEPVSQLLCSPLAQGVSVLTGPGPPLSQTPAPHLPTASFCSPIPQVPLVPHPRFKS